MSDSLKILACGCRGICTGHLSTADSPESRAWRYRGERDEARAENERLRAELSAALERKDVWHERFLELSAELSALRAAQPLTPCPTNHKTSWVPMRGLLSVVPTSWANFWRKSADGEPLITFCPDCGALLDSLADGETK